MKPCKGQNATAGGGKDLLRDGGELTEVLCEFDAVIEDFSSPINERHFQYEEHLERMKRRSSATVSDCSGISDSEKGSGMEPQWITKHDLYCYSKWDVYSKAVLRDIFEGADSLYRNSLSFSDEKLNSPTLSATAVSTPTVASPKAKLGDTKELEDFIADLDRTLANM